MKNENGEREDIGIRHELLESSEDEKEETKENDDDDEQDSDFD